jgi:hypothetical protein
VSARSGEPDDEVEALIVDRYLESLLARRPHELDAVPVHLEATVDELIRALPRYHPSFTFEEHLAARLAAAAAATGGRSPATGRLVPFSRSIRDGDDVLDRAALARPVVIGSVVTSAAISLAGAAFVAWRRTRPTDPMARAVRAVTRARIA